MIKNLEQTNNGMMDTSALINMNLKENSYSTGNLNQSSSIIEIPMKDTISQTGGFNVEEDSFSSSPRNFNYKQSSGLFGSPDKDFKINETINYRDILAWRERQDEWRDIERKHKMDINASLELTTSVEDKITIPI